jgi:hypothetical protein
LPRWPRWAQQPRASGVAIRARAFSHSWSSRPAADLNALDTLGKLYADGRGIGGYCSACQRVFSVSIVALIKERGGDCKGVGMKPLACPSCGGRRTRLQVTVYPKMSRLH